MASSAAPAGSDEQLDELLAKFEVENKIKDGAENLLKVFETNLHSGREMLRHQVEAELTTANNKIADLKRQIELLQKNGASSRTNRPRNLATPNAAPSGLGLSGFPPIPSRPGSFDEAPMSTSGPTPGSGPVSNSAVASAFSSAGRSPSRWPPPLEGRGYASLDYGPSERMTGRGEVVVDDGVFTEAEDAKTSRALAQTLLKSLANLSVPPVAPSGVPAVDTTTTSPAGGDILSNVKLSSPNLNASPSRVRVRAAALAASGPAHVRTPSLAPGMTDVAGQRIGLMERLVDCLKKNDRTKYELDAAEAAECILPLLSDTSGKEVRSAAYRLVRHLLLLPPSPNPLITLLRSRGLDIYLVRTLARDARFDIEKEQAIMLVRKCLEIGAAMGLDGTGTGTDTATVGGTSEKGKERAEEGDDGAMVGIEVMRALVAVAEHGEDSFRLVCLETLAECAILCPSLLSRSGGLRVLLPTLVDGPYDFSPTLIKAFLWMVDAPDTRRWLRPGIDLEIALSGFTEQVALKGAALEDRVKSTARVCSVMLRSWSGLLYLCMNDKQAIVSLVNALAINNKEVRDIMLDMFFEAFNIRASSWYDAFLEGRRLTMYRGKDGKPPIPNVPSTEVEAEQRPPERLNVVDHYLSLLLIVFIEAGLVDVLARIVEEGDQSSTRKATLLMGEILQVSNRVLPASYGVRVHALPRLFALASSFTASLSRQAASSALSSIDSFNRNRARLEPETKKAGAGARKRSNSIEESMRRGQRSVEKAKVRMGMQIDDAAFRNLLIETQVLNTKDHTKWHFDTLMETLEGPLLNSRRLEEAMRATKFVRRLLSFFHPFEHRFSDVRKTKPNRRYVKLGCTLLTTLLAQPDGVRFLAEDKLLKQIAECLNQLDPLSGSAVAEPLFSIQRMEDTLTYGYFEMLGTLSQSPEGIELLERFKIFTSFYHLSELKSREDLIKAIIENVDYTIDGHPRIVLSKALTSSYKHIRLYASHHLAELIRRYSAPPEWMIRLLLTQLYDPSMEVCELAVHIIEEACESPEILETVVRMRPTLDHLGEIGHPLLLRFLSTSVGFTYLWQGEYIDREMEDWFHDRNHRYVVQLEVFLAKSLCPDRTRGNHDEIMQFDGMVPPHFYGELAKTNEGCQVLQEKGHFAEFAHFIRQNGFECRDVEVISKLKSVLWAVGNIGSTKGGLPFLEAEDVVSDIVQIAEKSLVLSVRGTCFFVLGLISSTQQGADLLEEYGWEAVCTPLGAPIGLCVPENLNQFVKIPPWTTEEHAPPLTLELAGPESVIEREIMTAIANLSNSILANNTSRTLARLKTRHRRHFSDVTLFARALRLLGDFHYRLPVRRYIIELFDVKLDQHTVAAVQERWKRLREKKLSGKKAAPSSNGTIPAEPADETTPVRPVAHFGSRRSRVFAAAPVDDGIEGAMSTSDESAWEPEVPDLPKKVTLEPRQKIVGFA